MDTESDIKTIQKCVLFLCMLVSSGSCKGRFFETNGTSLLLHNYAKFKENATKHYVSFKSCHSNKYAFY